MAQALLLRLLLLYVLILNYLGVCLIEPAPVLRLELKTHNLLLGSDDVLPGRGVGLGSFLSQDGVLAQVDLRLADVLEVSLLSVQFFVDTLGPSRPDILNKTLK